MKSKPDLPRHYGNGVHFDAFALAIAPDDIPFWLGQAEKYGGPVLELACGTGRISVPLAEKGVQITGLDISEPLLEQARKKAAEKKLDIQFIHGDVRDFDLKKRFSLVFIPWNSIGHIHTFGDVLSMFACVKRHLADNGAFIVDFFNPRMDLLVGNPDNPFPVSEYPDPGGKGTVRITETYTYDAARQIKMVQWHSRAGDSPDVIKEELNVRIYFPQELDALITLGGFNIEAKYGDYDESAFTSESPKQLIVSRLE